MVGEICGQEFIITAKDGSKVYAVIGDANTYHSLVSFFSASLESLLTLFRI